MREPRTEATLRGDEREQLEAFLHDNRLEVLELLDGLTDEQARRRLVPSRTTLLGIVKHAAFAEQVWFHVALAGRTRAELGLPQLPGDSFVLADADTVASVSASYRTVVAQCEQIAAGVGLDELARHNRRGPLTLRWIYLHMIEELARHAGHGDILREQLLNADAPA